MGSIRFGIKIKSFLSLGLSVMGLAAGMACKSSYPTSSQQAAAEPPRLVKTSQVAEMPMERAVSATGTLAAYDQATLSVKVPGRLGTISIDLGSVVHRGEKIAQIEPRDYELLMEQARAALGQARARIGLPPEPPAGAKGDDQVDLEQSSTVRQANAVLDEARTSRERTQTLLKQGVIAQSQFDTAESAYKVALSRYEDALEEMRNRQAMVAQRRSELAIAEQRLADTSIYAPFDGIVQEKKASVGEYLAASAPVVTLVRVDPLRLRAEVPERDAQKVRIGQQVRVTVEGDPNVYNGRIMRLSPTLIEQNRMLVVEAEVHNSGTLRPGSFARAEIVTDNTGMVMTVPSKAIRTFAGIEKVVVVQEGKAVEKPITTGRRADDRVEIKKGLIVGEVVVVDPGNLQSGQAVRD